jgi:hypothetical protein
MGAQSGVAGTLDVSVVGNAGQLPVPVGAVAVAASNMGANSTITVNLPAAVGKTTYLTGLQITASGATAASVVQATIYLAGSAITLYYVYAVPAGVTALAPVLIVTFPNPISAGAANNVIQIILPALGAGNSNAAVSAQGFQL